MVGNQYLGPLSVSTLGNKYLLIVDYFSKWMRAHPIPNQEAKKVAYLSCLWFCDTYQRDSFWPGGATSRLHCSRTFVQTTPYKPQSDGMVERFNRTLESRLAMYVQDHQCDWDCNLPYLMMAYRSREVYRSEHSKSDVQEKHTTSSLQASTSHEWVTWHE